MPSKRYLGNIITDTPTAPAGEYQTAQQAACGHLRKPMHTQRRGCGLLRVMVYAEYGFFATVGQHRSQQCH